MTTAKDIMHTGAQWIPAHETLDRAAQMMRDHKVGALPVSANGEQDRMVGIITDRDIVIKCVASGHDPSKVTAGELCDGTPAGSSRRPTSARCSGRCRATGSAGSR